jgi:hypothetical protein
MVDEIRDCIRRQLVLIWARHVELTVYGDFQEYEFYTTVTALLTYRNQPKEL